MHFGVCYYPEQWPAERWAEDARLMRAAGLTIVRLAEFAWAWMEPAAGHYTWEPLDRAIATLAEAGLQIILGTPTATPPAWLTQEGVGLRVDANGRRRAHGSRRHVCPTQTTYRAHSRAIVTAMAQRYGQHPALIGWQIDNEFGGGHSARCYCDTCRTAFQRWLCQRYGSLEALNEAWGAIFWSQSYCDWAQIQLPDDAIDKKNPSHELDFFRFASQMVADYQQEQVDIVRALSPGRWVTHNFMGLYRDLDQFQLAAPLDFASWDSYPTGNAERWAASLYPPDYTPAYAYDVGDPIITSMAHAVTYGLKQRPFWIMEQQAGHINWGKENPGLRPGAVRLWVWHAAAAGAEAILYFRWRASRLAQEQYHSGLLRHDASFDLGWEEHQRLLAERPQLEAFLAAPRPTRAALLLSFDDLWAVEQQPHRAGFDVLRHLYVYFHAGQRLGIPFDILPFSADLSAYPLVIAPTAHLMDEATAAVLTAYVQQGGHLLLGVRSGFKTSSNLVVDDPLPGRLRPLVGARVSDWQALPLNLGWEVHSHISGLSGPATWWAERLQPETAHILAHYADGTAALVEQAVGRGRVWYLGFYPTLAQAGALLRHLAERLALPYWPDLPAGLLVCQRGEYTLYLNFSDVALMGVPPRDLRLMPAGS